MTTETTTPEIGATQSPANLNVRNESFYLERFKNALNDRGYVNGRVIDEDTYCEIYKGFAIVTWKQEWKQANKTSRIVFSNYVWEVGGVFDHLGSLGWIAQGCVATGYNADTHEKALKKSRKKVDLLAEIYSHKGELIALSQTYLSRGRSTYATPVYNALIGDVVAIRAFGRTRLGKVVKLVGSRFVVAYMTPSNTHDVHYKTLPLSQLYPKD